MPALYEPPLMEFFGQSKSINQVLIQFVYQTFNHAEFATMYKVSLIQETDFI
jgi:hypothetical protein